MSLRTSQIGKQAWFAVPVLLFLITGCGGGGGSTSSATPETPTLLNTNVQALPTDGSVRVTNLTDTSFTLTGPVPALTPGQIVVGGDGQGVLRKVVSTSRTAGSVIVTCAAADLTDVFQSTTLKTKAPLDYTSFIKLVPNDSTVRITPGGAPIKDSLGRTIAVPIHVSVHNKTPDNGAGVQVSMEVDMTLDAGFEWDYSIFSGLNHLKFAPSIKGTVQVSVVGTISKDLGKFKLFHLESVPIPVGGPIGVSLAGDVYVTLSGQVTGGMESPNLNFKVQTGFDYQKGTWPSPIHDAHVSVDPWKPNLVATASLKAGLRFEGSLLIEDVVGPYVSVDGPVLNVTATSRTTKPGLDLELDGGFDAGGGLKVEVFGRDLVNFSLPNLVDLSLPLGTWHVDFDGGVGVGIN